MYFDYESCNDFPLTKYGIQETTLGTKIRPWTSTQINKIMAQVKMTGNNSLKTSSASMTKFSLIKAFDANIHPTRVPSNLGWLICNCDGVYSPTSHSSGCGGIFKNCNADFILAFAESLSWDSSIHAEFCAVMKAIEIGKSKGWHTL